MIEDKFEKFPRSVQGNVGVRHGYDFIIQVLMLDWLQPI